MSTTEIKIRLDGKYFEHLIKGGELQFVSGPPKVGYRDTEIQSTKVCLILADIGFHRMKELIVKAALEPRRLGEIMKVENE